MENKEYISSLVFAAKNGNQNSFEALYNAYYQKIYALCLTTLKNPTDAEDALQLTFTSVWQNIGQLEDPNAFNTWIQRIALNRCYSIIRKSKWDISIDDDDEPLELGETEDEMTIPEVYAEKDDLKKRLKEIIDNLSDVQRQTLTLYYFSELSVEEIADVMSCSVSTVKSRLFLARKSIKTEIEEQETKTGQKFYGVIGIPMLPFSRVFVSQVKGTLISPNIASVIIKSVAQTIGSSAAAAGKAAGSALKAAANVAPRVAGRGVANTMNHAANTVSRGASTPFNNAVNTAGRSVHSPVNAVGRGASRTVGNNVGMTGRTASNIANPPRAGVSHAANFGTKTATKVAAKTGTRTVRKVAAKAGMAVWKKVVIGVVSTGIAVGGTAGTVAYVQNSGIFSSDEQTSNVAYVDAKLEAEDEAVKLLSRYSELCDEFYNFDKKGSVDAGLLYSLIVPYPSVDYGNYPVTKPVERSDEELRPILEKAGYNLDYMPSYEYDKESVFWIAENIFNLNRETFEKMINSKIKAPSSAHDYINYGDIIAAKGSDGKDKYYIGNDYLGRPDLTADITYARTDGKKYYVKFDYCRVSCRNGTYNHLKGSDVDDGKIYGTRYAVLERKEIDGKKYWTVYEISKNIPENVFSESSLDAFAKIKGSYLSWNSYSELEVDESGRSAGNYFHTALDGIHDYQHSQYDITFSTPEKIDKYTYRVKVEKLSYKNKVGSEDDQNGITTVYVESWDLKEGSTVYFYVKGTPIIKLIAECKDRFNYTGDGEDSTLQMNCVYIKEADCCYYESD